MTELQEEVLRLVQRAARDADHPIPGGASEEEVDALGTRLGLPVPEELRSWLTCCNGPRVGPGGLFGIRPDCDYLDIEARSRGVPSWREKGWIPVAGDGCGSCYVLALRSRTRSGHPVLFLDWEDARETVFDTASYVVGSGLWPFLRYILLREFDEGYSVWDERRRFARIQGWRIFAICPWPGQTEHREVQPESGDREA